MGSLSASAAGSFADLSGLTGALENGLAGNLLGGLGSSLAWAGGNTFVAAPDRGPNATPYNSLVDDHLSPQGSLEISGNTSGRVANKGMEGLAITPDGKTLWAPV